MKAISRPENTVEMARFDIFSFKNDFQFSLSLPFETMRVFVHSSFVQDKRPNPHALHGMQIHLFGRMHDGASVHVTLIDHKLVFYARTSLNTFNNIKHTATSFGKSYQSWWCDARVVEKRVFQGFKNNALDTVLEITAKGRSIRTALVKALQDHSIETFNTSIDPIHGFFHKTGLPSVGWVCIEDYIDPDDDDDDDANEHHFYCKCQHLLKSTEQNDLAPLKFVSFDIECLSTMADDKTYPFPDAMKPTDAITCMVFHVETQTEAGVEAHGFTFAPVDKTHMPSHLQVHAYESERSMLQGVIQWFQVTQPDVLLGWNILGFDLFYFFLRCKHCQLSLRQLGRLELFSEPRLRELTLSTAGAGHNEFKYFDIPGVILFDMLYVIRRDLKRESYKLNDIAAEFLQHTKLDMTPKEIFRLSTEPAGLARVLTYCDRDVELPLQLARKLKSFTKLIQFANLAKITSNEIVLRGANVKTLSLIANECHRRRWIISDKAKSFNRIEGKYAGATVLDPVVGLHDEAVATLDFKSLYPSIICSQNLCPSTFVEDAYELSKLRMPRTTKRFAWNESGATFTYTFVTDTTDALIPAVLQRLANERSEAKRLMKQATAHQNELDESIYDGIQLSVKLLMNSIYGFFGAGVASKIPHLPIAQTITFVGRQMIEDTKNFMLTWPVVPTQVVYGDTDSVFVKFQTDEWDRAKQLAVTWDLAERAANDATAYLNEHSCPRRGFIELEFEKVMFPLVLYSKKRYAGVKFLHNDLTQGKMSASGVQFVRRDLCHFARFLLEKSMRLFLTEGAASMEAFVRHQLDGLVQKDISVEELSVSKTLKAEYKKNPPPHAIVAKKKRSRGEDVTTGDRVAYVQIIDGHRLATANVECPDFVAENAIAVDFVRIFETQVAKPFIDLFEVGLPNAHALIHDYGDQLKRAQMPAERANLQRRQKMRPIHSYFAIRE